MKNSKSSKRFELPGEINSGAYHNRRCINCGRPHLMGEPFFFLSNGDYNVLIHDACASSAQLRERTRRRDKDKNLRAPGKRAILPSSKKKKI